MEDRGRIDENPCKENPCKENPLDFFPYMKSLIHQNTGKCRNL